MIDAAKKKDGLADSNITCLSEKPELDAARIKGKSTRENVRRHSPISPRDRGPTTPS